MTKSTRKLLIVTLLALLLVATLALVACNFSFGNGGDSWGNVFTTQTAYAEAQELGYTGSLEEFIASISGKDGTDGKDGVGIKSVTVNSENHLIVTLSNDFIVDCGIVKGEKGDKGDTGAQGPQGEKGDTGATGEKGDKGDQGEQGIQGEKGEDGVDGADGVTPQLKVGEDNFWYVSYDNGATWTCLNVKATGADGEQGEQGIQGEKGDTGETGAQGPQGEKGDTGATGEKGDKGDQGEQGIQGEKGEDGVDGADGVTPQLKVGEDNFWYVSYDNGETWTCLNVKATGVDGAQGEQGQQGIQGEKGDTGETGAQGPQGEKGDTGATGEKGDKGDQGEQGVQGEKGEDGVDGADGVTPQLKVGEDNFWYVSYDNGATWTSLGVKATGADGEQGEQGIQGEKGDTGATGEKGDKGDQGEQGIQGEKGEDGVDGADGVTPQLKVGEDNFWYVSYDNGETWTCLNVKATGADGAQGEQGIQGEKGDTGASGEKGDKGDTGEKGDQGEQGIQGEKGEDGVDGADGVTPQLKVGEDNFWYISYDNGATWTCLNVKATGADGEQGEQGPQGEKGDAGATGEKGDKGDTGAQGEKGDKGEQGVSIVSTTFDENGNTVITYSNGTTQTIAHNWQKSFVLVEANCITDGKELYSCTNCGLARIVTVPKTSHTYTEVVIEPSCAKGYTLHTCHCGDSYKDNYVEAIGQHNFQESDICKYCNQSITDVAVASCDMSATSDDNVYSYVVSSAGGKYDVYIKGTGAMRDYDSSTAPFYVAGYSWNIVSVYISDSVTSIGGYTFYKCQKLLNITIPDSVTSIGYAMFSGCSRLENITLPFVGAKADVTSDDNYQYPFGYIFGESSYTDVRAATQFYYGDSTSSTTSTTYYIPTSLKSVTITGGNILRGAFSNCSTLTSITIPNSVASIGDQAFYNCSSLTSITIPDSVTSVGNIAFSDCTGLTSVYYGGTIDQWVQISFVSTYSNPLFWGKNLYVDNKLVTEANITTATKILPFAFICCNSLTTVIIPDSVTSIGYKAFEYCSSLPSITIPDSVTTISSGAFQNCSGLASVYYGGTID